MSFETPQAVASELKLFTENDADLYRQQTTSRSASPRSTSRWTSPGKPGWSLPPIWNPYNRQESIAMMNGKQRARWLADLITELQRYTSKAKDAPETGHVRKALASLDDARRAALESGSDPEDP